MAYLVDGHNLIPKLGLRLDSPDDELALVARLQEFCRLQRTSMEVYFDGAPPGQAGSRRFGSVQAHFVRQGRTADEAIEARLKRLGRAVRNWTVVSSDRRVQVSARAVHARVIPAEEFARQLQVSGSAQSGADLRDADLSPEQVDAWLEEFKANKRNKL